MNEEKFKFRSRMRALTDSSVTALSILATVLVVAPLVAIFVYLVYKGASSLNLDFFNQIPKPALSVFLSALGAVSFWRNTGAEPSWRTRCALPPMCSTAYLPS